MLGLKVVRFRVRGPLTGRKAQRHGPSDLG
jgi:hypothetical protein